MSDSSSCGAIEFHPYGRRGISVGQTLLAPDYPLVAPSADIRYLVADCQLQVDDPGLYGGVPFKAPFRIYWLYGIGCDGEDVPPCSESSGASAPSVGESEGVVDALFCRRHDAEITIVDADNVVVFHSPDAADFMTREWGDRAQIYEWRDDRLGACLLTVHTKWSHDDGSPDPRVYPLSLFPEAAVLDERVVNILPKRVRSLTVVLDNLQRTPVELVSGYNMAMTTSLRNNKNRRAVSRITFDATPGGGLGKYPGCEPQPLLIRRVNGVSPTPAGDFFLAANGCYFVRQPTRITDFSPRRTMPQIALTPGSLPTLDLPDAAAGTAKNLPGWPVDDDPRYAHLQVGNDCKACCDCDDYVTAANYMNDVHDQYAEIGQTYQSIRDVYHSNITRWDTARACIERRPLRLFLQPQLCPFLDVVIQFCNHTNECVSDIELIAVVTTQPTADEPFFVPGYSFITAPAAMQEGLRANKTTRYNPNGTGGNTGCFFDYVHPARSAHARIRLKFPNCGMDFANDAAYAVTVQLSGTIAGEPIMILNSSNVLVPASVTETITLNCPATDDDTVNPAPCINC